MHSLINTDTTDIHAWIEIDDMVHVHNQSKEILKMCDNQKPFNVYCYERRFFVHGMTVFDLYTGRKIIELPGNRLIGCNIGQIIACNDSFVMYY